MNNGFSSSGPTSLLFKHEIPVSLLVCNIIITTTALCQSPTTFTSKLQYSSPKHIINLKPSDQKVILHDSPVTHIMRVSNDLSVALIHNFCLTRFLFLTYLVFVCTYINKASTPFILNTNMRCA